MRGLAQAVAIISALIYIAAAPLELFFFSSPRVRTFIQVEATTSPTCLWTGDEAVGRTVVVSALCYMLLASLAMGVAHLLGFWQPRGGSAPSTLGSSLPPLVALVAASL